MRVAWPQARFPNTWQTSINPYCSATPPRRCMTWSRGPRWCMSPAEAGAATVHIAVCYARPDSVFLKEFDVPAGTTIAAAIVGSGLQQACPEVDPSTMRVGIFGKLKTPETVVREGD